MAKSPQYACDRCGVELRIDPYGPADQIVNRCGPCLYRPLVELAFWKYDLREIIDDQRGGW